MILKYFTIVLLLSAFCNGQLQQPGSDNPQALYSYYDESLAQVLAHGDSTYQFIALEKPIHFYSEKYDHIYINTNGILTFATDFSEFLNQPFPLEYPSIAPFYSNVDTSGANDSSTIAFFKTQNSEKLQRASNLVRHAFSDHYEFNATTLYVATWENVGYYNGKQDKLNTFQAVLICSDDETYVQFIYPRNGLNWVQAEAGELGLPDIRAQAGFISEDGRYFTLEGSATENARYFNSFSNLNIPGVWLYRVGMLDFTSNVQEPNNPALKAQERRPRTCAEGLSMKCHIAATCIDKPEAGFCCKCNEGYYGNGFSCIKSTMPIRVTGSLTGVINDEDIDERAKLQSYIAIADGRSYTAINPVSPEIGEFLKMAIPIGGAIGWLFAKPVGESENFGNGYQLTGGKLTHVSTMRFPETGEVLLINQTFEGLNIWDQLTVNIEVSGKLPNLPLGTRVLLNDFTETYRLVSPETVESVLSNHFKIPDENREIDFILEQTIKFERCDLAESFANIPVYQRNSKVSLDYFGQEQALRTGLLTKIGTSPEMNPCVDGSAICGENTICIPNHDDDGYQCACKNGFAPIQEENGIESCVDIDECSGQTLCDVNADCVNVDGGYTCTCLDGFNGNGYECRGIGTDGYENTVDATTIPADLYTQYNEEEVAVTAPSVPSQPEETYEQPAAHEVQPEERPTYEHPETHELQPTYEQPDQHAYSECDECSGDGECIDGVCHCKDGYSGDGIYCTYNCQSDENWVQGKCVPLHSDDFVEVAADCNDTTNECSCPAGYSFIEEEVVCRSIHHESEEQIPCDVDFNCHPNATCVWSEHDLRHTCQCLRGHEGDGFVCNKIEVSCTTKPDLCDPHASCVYVEQVGKSQCKCDEGYEGDGNTCQLAPECKHDEHCSTNSFCANGVCLCREGFERDLSDFCVPTGKCGGTYCADNAICKSDAKQKIHYCECLEGYIGDGLKSCRSVPPPCNVRNTCGLYATCAPSYRESGKYECLCDAGYYGDGYVCVEEKNCRNTPALCDRNADCITTSTGLTCVCNTGFLGNGTFCKEITTHESGFLLISHGVVIVKVPFNGKQGRPISVASMAIGLDKDCVEGRVYWGDISGKKIMSAKYDGSDSRAFITDDIESPEGIAIDHISRRLYWTDSTKDTIEVANLDNPAQRSVIIHKYLVNPRGVAVDPFKNKLYWSDWNRESPKIEMSDLDGTGRETLLSQPNLNLPNSLVVQQNTGELCYVDAGTHRAECIDSYTKEIRTIGENLKYPFGLASTDDHFYWTDWNTKQVESVNATGVRQPGLKTLFFGSHKMYGMTAVVESCPLAHSPCQINNGGCPDDRLCIVNLNAPSSKSCKCSKLSKACNIDYQLD